MASPLATNVCTVPWVADAAGSPEAWSAELKFKSVIADAECRMSYVAGVVVARFAVFGAVQ